MSKKIAVIFGKMNPTVAEKDSTNHMSRTTTIFYVLQRYHNTQISKKEPFSDEVDFFHFHQRHLVRALITTRALIKNLHCF